MSVAIGVGAPACTSAPHDGAAPETPRAVGGAELPSCEVLAGDRSPDEGADEAAEGPGTGGVKVTVWYGEDDVFSAVLRGLIDEFAAAHPGVTVHLDRTDGGRSAVLERWRTTAPADRPSLALLPQDATRLLADSRQAVAPGPCLAEVVPDVVPAVEAAWSVDGVVQAVPFAVSTPVLVYNRQVFRDAGLDPDQAPATLGDLRTAAERIVSAGTADFGIVLDANAHGGAEWLIEQWNAQAGALSVTPDNGWGASARRAAWHEGPAVDHLAWLRDMIEDGLATSLDANASGVDDLVALVGERPTAGMTLHTSAALAVLSDAAEAGLPGFELGVAPLPGPGPRRGSLPGGAGLWLAADRDEAETRAAWSLAAFLASAEVQSRWASETGYAPVSEAARELEPLRTTWARRPQLAVGHDALSTLGTAPADLGMSFGPEREVKELLATALRAVVEGADPEAALLGAAVDADELLRSYNRGMDVADTG